MYNIFASIENLLTEAELDPELMYLLVDNVNIED